MAPFVAPFSPVIACRYSSQSGPNLKGEVHAYKLGQYVAKNDVADKTATIKKMRTEADAIAEKAAAKGKEAPKSKNMTITYNKGNGEVVSIDDAGIKDAKRSGAVGVAKILYKLGLGTRVEFFESFESKTKMVKDRKTGKMKLARVFINDQGVEQIAYSGVYRKSDGTIRVDLNAYNGRGLTLNALAHELTHFIQQWSDKKYKILADFLVKTYEGTDMTMHKRVLREQKRLEDIRGEEVSYDEAFDEVVANAMSKMFDDGKLVERLTELKAQDEKLARKLWEGFKKIMSKFLGIYQESPALFDDAGDLVAMKDTFEQLQGMFAEALVEASDNYQANLTASENQSAIQDQFGEQHSSQEANLDTEADSAYDGGKKKTDQEDTPNDTREESGEAFDRRTSEGLFRVSQKGQLRYAYKPYLGKAISERAKGAEKELRKLGISVFIYEKLETNSEGITISHEKEDSAAIPGVGVFIPFNAILDSMEIAGHEGFHFLAESKDRANYVSVLADNIDFPSAAFISYYNNIQEKYFKKDVAADSKESDNSKEKMRSRKLVEEIFAFITGDIHNGDPKGEVHKFLRDYDAVKAAWDDLIKKQATQKDQQYSSQETDLDYMEAVNSGDMETAHRMVDEAAKAAGYTVKVYHGTKNFGFTKINTKKSDDGISFFATEDLAVAGSYSGQVAPATRGINEKKQVLSRKSVPKLHNQIKAIAAEYQQEYTKVLGYYDDWYMSDIETITGNRWVHSPSDLIRFSAKATDIIAAVHENLMNDIDNPQTTRKLPTISEETRQRLSELKNEYTKKASDVISPYQDTGVYGFYANTDNHLVIDAQGGWWNDIKSDELPAKDGAWKTRDVAQYAKENGYSGVTFKNLIDPANNTAHHPATIYAFFNPKAQVKSADPVTYDKLGRAIPLSRRFNAENKDIRFSSQETDLDTKTHPYAYDILVSKPDMRVTTVDVNVPKNRADVVYQAKQNAAKVGKFDPKTGSVSVYVDDVGTDVLLGTEGLKHGLRRTKDAQNDANYIVTLKAGEIIKNSIKINETNPKKQNATGSYVLIGTARNANGDLYIVRSVVNQFKNELAAMDVLYAINAKKELAATKSPRSMAKPLSETSSTISIAELLDLVNQYFPDVLPEDVLKHYGYDARPEGDLGEKMLYSEHDTDYTKPRLLEKPLIK